ncbi:MAG: hypothetical protein H7Y88_06815, partial [Phycisphaerales bacterium]|nr:hypothetical protein [Phycisphaerales bacterium]
MGTGAQEPDNPDVQGKGAVGSLGRELGGDLPCVVCGYNLRGLSILAACPECGTAVRGTILAVVDPLARELAPIRNRWAVAAGLLLWTGFGLVAVLACWWPHVFDYLYGSARPTARRGMVIEANVVAVVCVVLSAIGATMLLNPHKGIGSGARLAGLIGVLAYFPVAWLVFRTGGGGEEELRIFLGADYVESVPRAVGLRVVVAGFVVGIVLALRPTVRVLVARSLALRSGRVDRQTLLAMALASAVAGSGYAVWLAAMSGDGHVGEVAWLVGLVLVGLGSALFTLGLAGSLLDSLRIARAIMAPSPTLNEVIEGRSGREQNVSAGAGGAGGGAAGGRL